MKPTLMQVAELFHKRFSTRLKPSQLPPESRMDSKVALDEDLPELFNLIEGLGYAQIDRHTCPWNKEKPWQAAYYFYARKEDEEFVDAVCVFLVKNIGDEAGYSNVDGEDCKWCTTEITVCQYDCSYPLSFIDRTVLGSVSKRYEWLEEWTQEDWEKNPHMQKIDGGVLLTKGETPDPCKEEK